METAGFKVNDIVYVLEGGYVVTRAKVVSVTSKAIKVFIEGRGGLMSTTKRYDDEGKVALPGELVAVVMYPTPNKYRFKREGDKMQPVERWTEAHIAYTGQNPTTPRYIPVDKNGNYLKPR